MLAAIYYTEIIYITLHPSRCNQTKWYEEILKIQCVCFCGVGHFNYKINLRLDLNKPIIIKTKRIISNSVLRILHNLCLLETETIKIVATDHHFRNRSA